MGWGPPPLLPWLLRGPLEGRETPPPPCTPVHTSLGSERAYWVQLGGQRFTLTEYQRICLQAAYCCFSGS